MKKEFIKDKIGTDRNNKWLKFRIFYAPMLSIILYVYYFMVYLSATGVYDDPLFSYWVTFYALLMIYGVAVYIMINISSRAGYYFLMFDIISNFIISLIPFKTKSTGASTSLSALTLYITVASIIYFNKRKHYWLGKKIKVNPDKIEVKKFVPVMQNLNKEIETIKKEIVSDANIDKPENIEKTENIKTKKPAKYCSKCGSLIDENKKCTGCGKQYIKIKPMKILLPLIYLVLLVVIALLVVQSVDDKRKIHDLSTRYENYATRYSDLYDDFQELDTENSKNKELITSIRKVYDIVSTEAIEYENQVAIVTGADNYYHTINCQTIYEGEAINIYSVRGAEGLGYTSCPFCH